MTTHTENFSLNKYNGDIMEYLVHKLRSRSINIQSTRNAFNNILDIKDYLNNRREMLKHLSELEDDLKQGYNAIKALMTQNKLLLEEKEALQKKQGKMEDQVNYEANLYKEQNAELLRKLSKSEEEAQTNKEEISFYLQRVTSLEEELKDKDRIIQNLMSMVRSAPHSNYHKEEEPNDKLATRTSEELSNLNQIIQERKSKKNLINTKIKHLFGNELVQTSENDNSLHSHTANQVTKIKNESIPLENKNCERIESKIPELVLKIVSSPENINKLNNKLGNDFLGKLMAQDASDSFLKKVKEVIEEVEGDTVPYQFEESTHEHKEGVNKNSSSNKLYSESNISNLSNKRSKYNTTNKSNPRTKSKTRSHSLNFNNSLMTDTSFEKSLRSYNITRQSHKVFNNFTNPHGRYFDDSLQKGGETKLRLARSMKNIKGNK